MEAKRIVTDSISPALARTLGRALLQRRRRIKKSQQYIGDRYGCDRSQISEIEHGKRKRLKTFREYDEFLFELAHSLGVEVRSLIVTDKIEQEAGR